MNTWMPSATAVDQAETTDLKSEVKCIFPLRDTDTASSGGNVDDYSGLVRTWGEEKKIILEDWASRIRPGHKLPRLMGAELIRTRKIALEQM